MLSDHPVGIAALTWDTTLPFDMRLVDQANDIYYSNEATIPPAASLRVGVRARGFFGLPGDPNPPTGQNMRQSFMNYTADPLDQAHRNLDGKGINRVHVFCYNSNSVFQGHTILPSSPYNFVPNQAPLSCTAGGYMKIVAEDTHLEFSGKTGTMIFKIQ